MECNTCVSSTVSAVLLRIPRMIWSIQCGVDEMSSSKSMSGCHRMHASDPFCSHRREVAGGTVKVEEVLCAFAEGADALERTGRLSSLFDPAAAARCRPSGTAALTARRQLAQPVSSP